MTRNRGTFLPGNVPLNIAGPAKRALKLLAERPDGIPEEELVGAICTLYPPGRALRERHRYMRERRPKRVILGAPRPQPLSLDQEVLWGQRRLAKHALMGLKRYGRIVNKQGRWYLARPDN